MPTFWEFFWLVSAMLFFILFVVFLSAYFDAKGDDED